MAEFIDRHRAVKDEKKVKQRLDTTIRYTKKKRYTDAADEDKKVIKESENLENTLTNLQQNRETKAQYKQQKLENRAQKKAIKRSRTPKEPKSENSGFDFSDLK